MEVSYHKNTANLKRFEKEAQIKEIQQQKTDKLLSVSDRAFWLFLHLIIEMEKHFRFITHMSEKYHKLTSMFIPNYQCSNVYIDMKKKKGIDEQRYTIVDIPGHPGRGKELGLPLSLAFSGIFGEFSKFKSSSVGLEKRSDFL